MTMRLPPVQPRSRLAHEAAAWAREAGSFDAMNEALFRGFFERGEDIGRIDVLMALADGAGLDSAGLRAALEAGAHRARVLDDEALAERYGLSGVPAFVAGGYGLVGMQTADALEELVRRASGGTPAGPIASPPVPLGRRRE